MADVLNLYYLFVEVVFGSLLFSAVGIAFGILVYGFFTKMSPTLLIFIIGLFIIAFGVGYVGVVVAIPIFVISMLWFGLSVANWIMQRA